MPAALAGPLDRMRTTLATMTLQQKATAAVLVLGLALGAFFFVRWVTTPTYQSLFTNLSAEDAAAITEELDAEGVAYELADGNGTIMVPKDQVYSLRLTMAGMGLTPQAGSDSGYSLLDEQGITTSEFQQQTTYQRAVAGELSNTLETMNGVKTASVLIAMPQEEVFVTDSSNPTAAVLLDLNAGTDLSGEQVQSIVNLVSGSITGMSPADVSVTDTDGRLLSSGGTGASTDSQADDTTTFQNTLAANAQRMLDQVLGAGNSIVTVAATLDFDQSQSTSQTYTYPNEIPPSSEQSTTETYTGTGAGAAGVLGTDGTTTTTAGDGSYDKTSTTTNNPVDTTTTTTIAAPGQVERLTVAVVLNSADEAVTIPAGSVQDLVGNAVALDAARGDAITVVRTPFSTAAAEAAQAEIAAAEAAEASEQMWSLVKTGVIVAALLLVVVLVWLRNRNKEEDYEDYEALDTEGFDEMERIQVPSSREGMDVRTAAAVEAMERRRLRGEITTMIETQPDAVASTLRGWLAENRT